MAITIHEQVLTRNMPGEIPEVTNEEILSRLAATDEPIRININQLQIDGFVKSETAVANFLNIPFGRIPGRFREAKIIDPREEDGVIDATKFGPICPQSVDIAHQTTAHLFPEILSDVSNSAEYSCLNLNIYAPPDAASSGEKLAVIVWIHGGAFRYGANTKEYDGNYIVQHSIHKGKPVILVSLNYRLGYYGFLSSKELKDEAARLGEIGFANLGLHDQRLGLQWVQRNIHFFGGDGFKVTAAGESAGACSILFHLRSDFPAFQRAFILSPANVSLVDDATAQATFDQLVCRCGIPASTPARQKIDLLRSLSPEKFDELNPPSVTRPIWDDKWFVDQNRDSEAQDSRPFPSWIRSIVIGSTKEEMALFGKHWTPWTGAQSVAALKTSLGDTEFTKKVLETYNIKSDEVPGSSFDSLVQLGTDFIFGKVAYDVAASHRELPVAYYSFEQKDTFPHSLFKGRAYHSLGNCMIFRLPTVQGPGVVDPDMKITSDLMCEAAVGLAHGEQPWEPFAMNHRIMIFDGERSGLADTSHKPRWSDLPLSPINLSLLMKAVFALMQS